VGRSSARFLRCREVCARTGLSRTTLWRLEWRGGVSFPAPPPARTGGGGGGVVGGWVAVPVWGGGGATHAEERGAPRRGRRFDFEVHSRRKGDVGSRCS